jgi:hypothetical protein
VPPCGRPPAAVAPPERDPSIDAARSIDDDAENARQTVGVGRKLEHAKNISPRTKPFAGWDVRPEAMSYRNDVEALQTQVQQLEGELVGVRRERLRLEAATRDEPRLVTELDKLRKELHARAPRHLPMLDDIRVASPCHERWDAMTGDEQARHCGSCNKNVYNLSAMTREAAEALVREKEGKLCVRYFRRADGTILTADCPVGVRRKRVQLVAAAGAMTALAAGAAAAMFAHLGAPQTPSTVVNMMQGEATTPTSAPPVLNTPPASLGEDPVTEVMGDVAAPARPTPPQTEPRMHPRMGRRMMNR